MADAPERMYLCDTGKWGLIASKTACTTHHDDIPYVRQDIADERVREARREIVEVRECDKCDLCEDHHV